MTLDNRHNYAISLEEKIRSLFNYERTAIYRLINADNFENNPLSAAFIIMTYIYLKNITELDNKCAELIDKYSIVLENKPFTDTDYINYMEDLSDIINALKK